MPIDWPRFALMIGRHQRFLLTSHIRPDCDALGSELAMGAILESLGKSVRIVNGQSTPPNLKFIDTAGKLLAIGVDIQPADLADVEAILILDTSAWAQLGKMADVVRESKCYKAVLDHHVGEDDLGAELFKDPTAEATGRLVFEAAKAMGVALTADMAGAMYAAIATDTGWFRFASTSSETMRVAGALMDAGALPSKIYNRLYEQDTLARLQLRGRILARVKTELDGQLAHTAALAEDFAATGALPSDTEDVINLTLTVAGTLVAFILVEQAPEQFKISFRSRSPKVDCNALAGQFGGGGHKAAAGASIRAPFEAAQARVLDAVKAALR